MPDDSNGIYNVPSGTLVNTGDTVLPSQHNPWATDSSQAISNRFSKDGRAPATGDWDINNFRLKQVADPTASGDAANKNYVDTQITAVNQNAEKISTQSGNYTALLADKATSFRFTASSTLSLTAAATLGANWFCEVWATNGNVIIDPDAAETINGAPTLVLQTGQAAKVFCTGTAFFAWVFSDSLSGPQIQGYSFGLNLTTNATDAANDIDIAVGSAASDISPYYLMRLTTTLTKRIDATWAVGNNNGGLDTGAVAAAGTYYIWLIQRSDTGVVDALFSLSSTAPTMPGNYDRKRLIGRLARTASVNGLPFRVDDQNPLGLKYGVTITASTAAININSGIPSDAKRITLVSELSSAAAMQPLIQIGTGGVLDTSGYTGVIGVLVSGSTTATAMSNSFLMAANGALAGPFTGIVTLTRQDPTSNKWIFTCQLTQGASAIDAGSASKTLSGPLDRIQIGSSAGTVSFSGTLGIIVERF